MLSYDVVEWGKPLERIERITPMPRNTEVFVRLKYCGVCHSDVHIRDGYFDLGGGRRFHMSERGMCRRNPGISRTEPSSLLDRMPAAFPSVKTDWSFLGSVAAPVCVAAMGWSITAWRRT